MIISVLSVLLLLVGFASGLCHLVKKFALDREIARKLLHSGMGLVVLCFPWIFDDWRPVFFLSFASIILLLMMKNDKNGRWSSIVCAPGRDSLGEMFYPLAIGITFYLAGDNSLFYLLPISLLVFSDSASAVIGKAFGRRFYATHDGVKTIEGSLAFALISFVCSIALLSIFPIANMSLTGADLVLFALLISCLSMLLEALSWKGLDNLLVPLGTYMILRSHAEISADALVSSLIFSFLLSLLVIVGRKSSTLDGSGLACAALVAYAAFFLGGIAWTLPPVSLCLTYRVLLPRRYRHERSRHSSPLVLIVSVTALLWLAASIILEWECLLFPYALSFASQSAIISIAHIRFRGFNSLIAYRLLLASLTGWSLCCLPLLFIVQTSEMRLVFGLLAPFCIFLSVLIFYFSNNRKSKPANRPSRWLKQSLSTLCGSVIGFLLF
jgi:phytol kinase